MIRSQAPWHATSTTVAASIMLNAGENVVTGGQALCPCVVTCAISSVSHQWAMGEGAGVILKLQSPTAVSRLASRMIIRGAIHSVHIVIIVPSSVIEVDLILRLKDDSGDTQAAILLHCLGKYERKG